MNTKLTLRVDDKLIERAKRYSKERGKSLSSFVSDLFAVMTGGDGTLEFQMTPTVKRLKGSLKGAEVSKEEYRSYLEKKYL